MVPELQVDAPETTILDEPLNVPLDRSSELSDTVPVLLKTAVPPLTITDIPFATVAVLVNVVVPLANVVFGAEYVPATVLVPAMKVTVSAVTVEPAAIAAKAQSPHRCRLLPVFSAAARQNQTARIATDQSRSANAGVLTDCKSRGPATVLV
jgi:hypothetical protein